MSADNAPTPRPVSSKPKPKGSVAKQAASIRREADEAIRLADPAALRSKLAFTDAHLDVLDQISSGLPVKNAVAILAAARLRLDFTLAKPAQGVVVDQTVSYQLIDPYADDPNDIIEVRVMPTPALPPAGNSGMP